MAVIINASTSAGAVTTADTSGVLQLQTGGTAALTVDASQNVGIGTSSPGAKLVVTGAAAGAYGAIIYNTSATGQGLTVRGGSTSSQDAFNVQTYDGGASLLAVQAGGNVGIGISSPQYQFQIAAKNTGTYSASNTLTSGASMGITNASTTSGTAATLLLNPTGAGGGNPLATISAYQIATGSAAVTIGTRNSGGNVVEGFRVDQYQNVYAASSVPPSNMSAGQNPFMQMFGQAGGASTNSILNFVKVISDNTATTILTVTDATKWAGTILVSYVREVDQNRSGTKMVRFAYPATFFTLLDSNQNSVPTFSVSGNNIQLTISGAGPYYCQFTILSGAGA